MATGSTPSSGTEEPDPQATGASDERSSAGLATPPDGGAQAVDGGADPVDSGRRAFFLQFGRQAVSSVGQVAGMADAASRTASALAGELLGLDEPSADERPTFARSGATSDPVVSAAPAGEDAFRSAYRLAGDELVLLDQRRIPEALEEVVARRGSDVAYYLRLGVARGGPLMAQLAAYGLALTAAERADQPADQRDQELRRTERALVEARPSARLPGWAGARLRSAISSLPGSTPGAEVAAVLRSEADDLAGDISRWQAAIAGHLALLLSAPSERPLCVLLHGSQGALAGGLVGSGVAALAQLRDAGQAPRVFVTEGRPFMDGARLASWELRQAGLEHRVVPDAAVAWLFEREPVDAVLIGAEWIAANGDVGALVGSRGIAQLAAARSESRPRVVVSGLGATRHEDTPDGSAIPVELRPATELAAYLADVPIRASDALVPAADVIPAGLVDGLVTEQGAGPASAD